MSGLLSALSYRLSNKARFLPLKLAAAHLIDTTALPRASRTGQREPNDGMVEEDGEGHPPGSGPAPEWIERWPCRSRNRAGRGFR